MDLASINTQIANALPGARGATAAAAGGGKGGFDFASTLDSALKEVSRSQAQTAELERQFEMDNPNVSLEQTMVALNTSTLNFTAAIQVRNKLVQAYDQIMNMQV